uniref:Uncharacterized protein n=1 Tax=Cannabis sativa TaxID=3483 RepID=A0A803Q7L5_CANSA
MVATLALSNITKPLDMPLDFVGSNVSTGVDPCRSQLTPAQSKSMAAARRAPKSGKTHGESIHTLLIDEGESLIGDDGGSLNEDNCGSLTATDGTKWSLDDDQKHGWARSLKAIGVETTILVSSPSVC